MPVITPHVPDGLIDLMKGLAKNVIKDHPEKIYEYAALHFEKLLLERDGRLDKGYESFTAREKYFKGRQIFEVTFSNKFVCKRTLGEGAKKCDEDLQPVREDIKDYVTNERYIKAIYVIQRYMKRYIAKKKTTKKDLRKSGKVLSEEAAALVIQRTLRAFITTKKKTKAHDDFDDASDAASYTSSSTLRLMPDTPDRNETNDLFDDNDEEDNVLLDESVENLQQMRIALIGGRDNDEDLNEDGKNGQHNEEIEYFNDDKEDLKEPLVGSDDTGHLKEQQEKENDEDKKLKNQSEENHLDEDGTKLSEKLDEDHETDNKEYGLKDENAGISSEPETGTDADKKEDIIDLEKFGNEEPLEKEDSHSTTLSEDVNEQKSLEVKVDNRNISNDEEDNEDLRSKLRQNDDGNNEQAEYIVAAKIARIAEQGQKEIAGDEESKNEPNGKEVVIQNQEKTTLNKSELEDDFAKGMESTEEYQPLIPSDPADLLNNTNPPVAQPPTDPQHHSDDTSTDAQIGNQNSVKSEGVDSKRKSKFTRSHLGAPKISAFQNKVLSNGQTYEYFEISGNDRGVEVKRTNLDPDTGMVTTAKRLDDDDGSEFLDSLNDSITDRDSLEIFDVHEDDSLNEKGLDVVNEAAVMIQKTFRGYKVRKEIAMREAEQSEKSTGEDMSKAEQSGKSINEVMNKADRSARSIICEDIIKTELSGKNINDEEMSTEEQTRKNIIIEDMNKSEHNGKRIIVDNLSTEEQGTHDQVNESVDFAEVDAKLPKSGLDVGRHLPTVTSDASKCNEDSIKKDSKSKEDLSGNLTEIIEDVKAPKEDMTLSGISERIINDDSVSKVDQMVKSVLIEDKKYNDLENSDNKTSTSANDDGRQLDSITSDVSDSMDEELKSTLNHQDMKNMNDGDGPKEDMILSEAKTKAEQTRKSANNEGNEANIPKSDINVGRHLDTITLDVSKINEDFMDKKSKDKEDLGKIKDEDTKYPAEMKSTDNINVPKVHMPSSEASDVDDLTNLHLSKEGPKEVPLDATYNTSKAPNTEAEPDLGDTYILPAIKDNEGASIKMSKSILPKLGKSLDLLESELQHEAATKIQKVFKGFTVRKNSALQVTKDTNQEDVKEYMLSYDEDNSNNANYDSNKTRHRRSVSVVTPTAPSVHDLSDHEDGFDVKKALWYVGEDLIVPSGEQESALSRAMRLKRAEEGREDIDDNKEIGSDTLQMVADNSNLEEHLHDSDGSDHNDLLVEIDTIQKSFTNLTKNEGPSKSTIESEMDALSMEGLNDHGTMESNDTHADSNVTEAKVMSSDDSNGLLLDLSESYQRAVDGRNDHVTNENCMKASNTVLETEIDCPTNNTMGLNETHEDSKLNEANKISSNFSDFHGLATASIKEPENVTPAVDGGNNQVTMGLIEKNEDSDDQILDLGHDSDEILWRREIHEDIGNDLNDDIKYTAEELENEKHIKGTNVLVANDLFNEASENLEYDSNGNSHAYSSESVQPGSNNWDLIKKTLEDHMSTQVDRERLNEGGQPKTLKDSDRNLELPETIHDTENLDPCSDTLTKGKRSLSVTDNDMRIWKEDVRSGHQTSAPDVEDKALKGRIDILRSSAVLGPTDTDEEDLLKEQSYDDEIYRLLSKIESYETVIVNDDVNITSKVFKKDDDEEIEASEYDHEYDQKLAYIHETDVLSTIDENTEMGIDEDILKKSHILHDQHKNLHADIYWPEGIKSMVKGDSKERVERQILITKNEISDEPLGINNDRMIESEDKAEIRKTNESMLLNKVDEDTNLPTKVRDNHDEDNTIIDKYVMKVSETANETEHIVPKVSELTNEATTHIDIISVYEDEMLDSPKLITQKETDNVSEEATKVCEATLADTIDSKDVYVSTDAFECEDSNDHTSEQYKYNNNNVENVSEVGPIPISQISTKFVEKEDTIVSEDHMVRAISIIIPNSDTVSMLMKSRNADNEDKQVSESSQDDEVIICKIAQSENYKLYSDKSSEEVKPADEVSEDQSDIPSILSHSDTVSMIMKPRYSDSEDTEVSIPFQEEISKVLSDKLDSDELPEGIKSEDTVSVVNKSLHFDIEDTTVSKPSKIDPFCELTPSTIDSNDQVSDLQKVYNEATATEDSLTNHEMCENINCSHSQPLLNQLTSKISNTNNSSSIVVSTSSLFEFDQISSFENFTNAQHSESVSADKENCEEDEGNEEDSNFGNCKVSGENLQMKTDVREDEESIFKEEVNVRLDEETKDKNSAKTTIILIEETAEVTNSENLSSVKELVAEASKNVVVTEEHTSSNDNDTGHTKTNEENEAPEEEKVERIETTLTGLNIESEQPNVIEITKIEDNETELKEVLHEDTSKTQEEKRNNDKDTVSDGKEAIDSKPSNEDLNLHGGKDNEIISNDIKTLNSGEDKEIGNDETSQIFTGNDNLIKSTSQELTIPIINFTADTSEEESEETTLHGKNTSSLESLAKVDESSIPNEILEEGLINEGIVITEVNGITEAASTSPSDGSQPAASEMDKFEVREEEMQLATSLNSDKEALQEEQDSVSEFHINSEQIVSKLGFESDNTKDKVALEAKEDRLSKSISKLNMEPESARPNKEAKEHTVSNSKFSSVSDYANDNEALNTKEGTLKENEELKSNEGTVSESHLNSVHIENKELNEDTVSKSKPSDNANNIEAKEGNNVSIELREANESTESKSKEVNEVTLSKLNVSDNATNNEKEATNVSIEPELSEAHKTNKGESSATDDFNDEDTTHDFTEKLLDEDVDIDLNSSQTGNKELALNVDEEICDVLREAQEVVTIDVRNAVSDVLNKAELSANIIQQQIVLDENEIGSNGEKISEDQKEAANETEAKKAANGSKKAGVMKSIDGEGEKFIKEANKTDMSNEEKNEGLLLDGDDADNQPVKGTKHEENLKGNEALPLADHGNTHREDTLEDLPVNEEPCIKRNVSLTFLSQLDSDQIDVPAANAFSNMTEAEIEKIDISKFGKDSLEAMYYSLRKNEIMVDRMQRRASEHKIPPIEVEPGSQEATYDPVKPLEEIEDTPIPAPRRLFQKMHTVAGDRIMQMDSTDEAGDSLDDATEMAIRQKMMAYSISEADSDCFDMATMGRSQPIRDDFNISTALEPATSTDTDSTIISAATKLQAGARGFLTRRKLRRASEGAKSSISEKRASFGNEAISESLENLIEEESAKKIQRFYRSYRARRGIAYSLLKSTTSDEFNTTGSDQNYTSDDEHTNEEGKSDEADDEDAQPPINFEGTLAARRLTLQRGDAVQKDSTPDEENGGGGSGGSATSATDGMEQVDEIKEVELPAAVGLPIKSKSTNSSEARRTASRDHIKWMALRQNSMPVQIDSELLRVIPKHMRKRIKSADTDKKKKRNILQ